MIEQAYIFSLWGIEDNANSAQVNIDFPHTLRQDLTGGNPNFTTEHKHSADIWDINVDNPVVSVTGSEGIRNMSVVAAPFSGANVPPDINVLGVKVRAESAVLDSIDASGTHVVVWRTDTTDPPTPTAKEPESAFDEDVKGEVSAIQTWINGRGVTTTQFVNKLDEFLRIEGLLGPGDSALTANEMSQWMQGNAVAGKPQLQSGTRRKFTNVINKWWGSLQRT